MKLRAIALVGGMLLAGVLSAQTLTDAINEFNTGVEKVNNQEYDASIENFNSVLSMAETIGAEADDVKGKAEQQIPMAYYRQATLFLKRKQYDNAIPYLENTVETATSFDNNEETKTKAGKFLLQSYMREGQRGLKNKDYDAALSMYDKSLAMNENLYQAHLGKGMVFKAQNEIDAMLEEFDMAKAGALAKNDTKTIATIDGVVDKYYATLIMDEVQMIDPEEPDYTYVEEVCDKALEVNPGHAKALYHMALVSNKKDMSDAAIDFALKALESETEPVFISANNYELGLAYEATERYEEACETWAKVMEEPFLSKAERRIDNLCN